MDIDISRDQRDEDKLVKRSRQIKVLQTDSNSEIIVGFEKN